MSTRRKRSAQKRSEEKKSSKFFNSVKQGAKKGIETYLSATQGLANQISKRLPESMTEGTRSPRRRRPRKGSSVEEGKKISNMRYKKRAPKPMMKKLKKMKRKEKDLGELM